MSMPSNPFLLDSQTLLTNWFTQNWPSVDQRYVTLTIDAVNSQLVLTSSNIGTDGTSSIYGGTGHLPYTKSDVSQAVLYPVTYDGPWPTTYRLFKGYLLQRYGLVLENGEFTLPGNSVSTPLQDTDPMDAQPGANSGLIALTAATTAARWLTGTKFCVVLAPSNGPVRLPALIDTNRVPSLQWLTDRGSAIDPVALSIFTKLVGWWDWSVPGPLGTYLDRVSGITTTMQFSPASDGGQPVGQIVQGVNGKGQAYQSRYTHGVNGVQGGYGWAGGPGSLNIDQVCGSTLAMVSWFRSTDTQMTPIFGRGFVTGSGGIADPASFKLSMNDRFGDQGKVQFTCGCVTPQQTNNTLYLISNKATNFRDGNWHYGGIQVDTLSADLYTDGTLDATAPMSGNLLRLLTQAYPGQQSMLMWDSMEGAFSQYFTGAVSNTALFNQKLTPQEHAWLYNNGQARSYDELVAAAGM